MIRLCLRRTAIPSAPHLLPSSEDDLRDRLQVMLDLEDSYRLAVGDQGNDQDDDELCYYSDSDSDCDCDCDCDCDTDDDEDKNYGCRKSKSPDNVRAFKKSYQGKNPPSPTSLSEYQDKQEQQGQRRKTISKQQPTTSDGILEDCNRRKLCDWAYLVVDHFRIQREIVYQALYLTHRYLLCLQQQQQCRREERQCRSSTELSSRSNNFRLALMVGIHLCSKVHACRPVPIAFLVALSKREFTEQDLMDMELKMLQTLEWKINPPSTSSFIQHFMHLLLPSNNTNQRRRQAVQHAAIFFSELAVYDDALFRNNSPSVIALACLRNSLQAANYNDIKHEAAVLEEEADFVDKVLPAMGWGSWPAGTFCHIQERLWQIYSQSADFEKKEASMLASFMRRQCDC